jgi:hypothetical protein
VLKENPLPTDPHFSKPRGITMLDDLDRLRHNPHLLQLLSHYAELGEKSPETWQTRLMEMAEVEPRHLVKLHGELIAFGWVEQNTGQVPTCYRITLAGLRASRKVRVQETEEDDLSVPEKAGGGSGTEFMQRAA